jgi:hypothetical protein
MGAHMRGRRKWMAAVTGKKGEKVPTTQMVGIEETGLEART